MPKYIVRVCIDNTFAQQRMPQLGQFWHGLHEALPQECAAELSAMRFSFAMFDLTAQTKQECKDMIKAAWETAFPGESGLTEILVAENTENEHSELMRTIYKNYYGVDSYLRLITELNDTIPLLRDRGAVSILIQQNYLFAADDGCGFTTLLRSMGDFIHRTNVYPEEEFKDRISYTEYRCGKETENGYGSADDVIASVRELYNAKSHNIVGFDISYFLDGRKYDELRSFIHRLEDMQDSLIFAFRIPFLERKALDDITSVLSDMMLLKVVQIPPLSDSVLMETVWNTVTSKDYTFDVSIMDAICEKLHREKMDGRSYGFKTAEKVSFELMLCKSADDADKQSKGDSPDLQSIEPGSLGNFLPEEKEKLTGYDALNELIGMQDITQRVKEIIAQVKVSIKNEKLDRPCIHMRFTGAPGTGKTTVARIIGQILREEGVLRKGGFFEYEARELVAQYEGQTAVKTASICRDAYGSVLFIDEAYALNEGNPTGADFGKEAIATLVAEMENHRDDMLVVMAGYEKDMDDLMKVNNGLRSRMPYILHFPNYTRQQLFEIFMLMVKKHFEYDPQLEQTAKDYFLSLADGYLESKEFANARFVRNLYERTWSKGALRCTLDGRTDITLTKEDFIGASSEKEFNEKIESKKTLGFSKV